MENREIWKALNLLYQYGQPTLSRLELAAAGVGCYNRIFEYFLSLQIMNSDPQYPDSFRLQENISKLMREFIILPSPSGIKLEIDFPEAFIVMPYSQAWSTDTYELMIKPAVVNAGLICTRGDENAKVGELSDGVLRGILQAGIVVVEVSEPNMNVYYELGIAHAFSKDVLLLKQSGSSFVPADIKGVLYCEYELDNLSKGCTALQKQIESWSRDRSIHGVKDLSIKYGR